MSESHDPIATIVERARALGPLERVEYVRRACGADETLLSQVLLALDDLTTSSGVHEVVDERTDLGPPPQLEGQRLGPYRITRKLGSGGMGDVYLAERADDEYQQQVAIKLVRHGAFSPQIHGRLRQERQILARLQHPNIARLLDGGRAPDGTPYLVMEYIDGEPIDAYCDRRRLPVEERIRLVRLVCSAVQYAHQNLIVHRDLKPNNILITADGVPKLLDFGIAKLLDTRQSAHTLAVTHFEYRVLTPAHASPEQIRGEAITTASDIYVLGVLLYELLCGRRPFQLVGSSLAEMERIVCEQNAPPPSATLARTLQESPELAMDIAECRSSTPARLVKQLRGDLDCIVGMAMRKEPDRRYSSAEQLGADLERLLAGKPVVASNDTWLYRTRKFVARHLIAVTASAAAIALLTTFAIVTAVQARRIAQERDIATAERTRAEQVSSFLIELFELSDPSRSRGNEVTAREVLDIGARRVSVGLANQPETRATLLGTIGRVYSSLGLYGNSIELLEDALESRIALHGNAHPQVAVALVALGDALCEQGQLAECDGKLSAALKMQQELFGATALPLAPTLLSHGRLAQQRGALDVAQRYFEQSLAIYRRHDQERTPEASSVLSELAGLHSYRGEHARAETLLRTALDIDQQVLGKDHPQVATNIQNLAVALQMQGKLEEAEPLYVESTRLMTRVLGDTHPQTIDAMANYGRFLHRKQDLGQAEAVLEAVVAANRKARGAQHALVGHDLVNLGLVRLDAGRNEEAAANLREALDIYAQALPGDHPYIASALSALGRAQLEQGRLRDAEHTLREAIRIAASTLPPESPQIASAKSSLGRTLLAQGQRQEAAALLTASQPILANAYGEDAVLTRRTREALAEANGDRERNSD